MDAIAWPPHQGGIGLVNHALVATAAAPSSSLVTTRQAVEKKARPHKERALNCPRCNSNNTKFCYYNNYSLTQPRYFCKTCRRYWTEGGTLRNVPVGGGSRKNKRHSLNPPTMIAPVPQAAAGNPGTSTSQQSELCGLFRSVNAANSSTTWESGSDLLLRGPFAPVLEPVGVDPCGYAQTGVMPFQELIGRASAADLQALGIHGGGDLASGGIWNW